MIVVGEAFKERCDLLENTEWAKDFSWHEIKEFARYMELRRAIAGMPVFCEGDRDPYICILVQGCVQVVKENRLGYKRVIAVIKEGKTFGEMALFDGEPRSATIIASEHSLLLVLTKENAERLVSNFPVLGAKLLYKLGKQISQRLRMTSGRLIDYI